MAATHAHHPSRIWLSASRDGQQHWPGACQKGGLNVHLNFSGEAEIRWRTETRILMHPGTVWWVRGPSDMLKAARRNRGREAHECLTLFFPDTWLTSTLQNTGDAVSPAHTPLVMSPFAGFASLSRPLTEEDRIWARTLMAPHLCEQARQLLDGARLTEFLVREVFPGAAADTRPQSRTERLARERIERVKTELLRRLDSPPTLGELSALVGYTASHLSRTFRQIEGTTLTLWLRRARVDRAAELIACGRCNVSEAAIEVGYQSFSHFSRAFFLEKGVQPSRWTGHLHPQSAGALPPAR
jgi:AraC-like DNA-binding protein